MTQERRKFPRLNWNVKVRWKRILDVPDETSQHTGAARDISAGGICLILKEGVEVGDILELEISLGEGKNICSRGRVIWVDRFEITGGIKSTGYEGGIEFLGMSDEAMLEINRFVFQDSSCPLIRLAALSVPLRLILWTVRQNIEWKPQRSAMCNGI